MGIKLEGIKFNYDPDLSKTGAFNLRRNETQIVPIPEWQPNLPSKPEASPAAYAICGLPKDMTIQASFNRGSGLNAPLFVRAVAEFTDHILGDIEPVEIPNTGSSGFVTLKLPDARVSVVGVGIHDISWRWQFSNQPRTEPQLWKDFQTTHHRIYTVLARPSEPWEPKSRESSNIHQPWTEVLDHACRWANGASGDLDRAAELITQEFFELGRRLLRYKRGASYAYKTFDCTGFLNLLRTGKGKQRVNCDDCATVVSTFANILGCQLSQSSMGTRFSTQPIVLIGTQEFDGTGFFYHSVAWKGECRENDEVFDGCLQIDEDLMSPLIPVQPTNLPFGTTEAGYRFSVVRDPPDCRPIPDDPDYGRRRRKLRGGYLADVGISTQELVSELKAIYEFNDWPKAEEEENRSRTFTDILKQPFLTEWAFYSGELFQDERFQNVIEVVLKRDDSSLREFITINLYDPHKTSDPNFNLLEILARFEGLDLKRLTNPAVGVLTFTNQDDTTVLFRRKRFLAVVQSVGTGQLSVLEMARILDSFLR